MEESGWLVISLLSPAQEFSEGINLLIDYLEKNQGSNMVAL
jgi:hypothetical protein